MVDCKKIEDMIHEKGIMQKELAEAVGISEQMVSYIIRGLREPSITVLSRIAKALGCTTAELLVEE